MARTFNGSTQYLSASSTLLSNEPITMVCLANPNDVTNNYIPMGLGNNGAAGNYFLQLAGAVASDPIRAGKDDDAGSGAVLAASTAGYSASAWNHTAVNFGSDTSRDAFVSGANKGSNATSRTDPTPDFVSVGALVRNSVVQPFAGSIAEAFIFDINPTDAQHALLALGIHPIDVCIPVANIRAWYPLMGDDNNRMAGGYPDLSPTASPTFSSHPPKPIYPRIGALISV